MKKNEFEEELEEYKNKIKEEEKETDKIVKSEMANIVTLNTGISKAQKRLTNIGEKEFQNLEETYNKTIVKLQKKIKKIRKSMVNYRYLKKKKQN